MNKAFVAKGVLEEYEEIQFKIVDFNAKNDISISNIETTSFGLLDNLRNENQFLGIVKEILDYGLIIELNNAYMIGYLPNDQISNILSWNFDYKRIKIGAKIKVSITKFDFKGIYLSRVIYKQKERRATASYRYTRGEKFQLKIVDKMAKFGILVANQNIKGIVGLESILPIEVIQNINKLDFVIHCKNIFKRKSIVDCVIEEIDFEHKKILFDLDYSSQENILRIHSILTFFDYDLNLYNCVEDFYKKKSTKNNFMFVPNSKTE